MSDNPSTFDQGAPSGAGAPERPAPKKSSAVKITAILVLVVLIAAGLVWNILSKKAAEEARSTLELVLDRIAGQGNWTVESVSYGIASKTATATKLSISLKEIDPSVPGPLTVDVLEISNPIRRQQAEAILALPDWRGQPAAALADKLTFRNLKLAVAEEASATIIVGQIAANALSLDASPPDAEPGRLGFLKSLRLQSLSLSALDAVAGRGGEVQVKAALDKLETEGLRLSPQAKSADSLGDLLLALVQTRQTAKGLRLTTLGGDGAETFTLTLAEQVMADVVDLSYGALSGKGLAIKMALDPDEPGGPPVKVDMSLGEASLTGLDLKPFYERFLQTMERYGDGSDGWEEPMERLTALSDLFTLPYSLGSALARDFKLSVDSALTVSADLASFEGPAVAGEVPPLQSWNLVNLRIELPTAPAGNYLDKFFEFGRDFGQSSFNLGYSVKATYDPSTGQLAYSAAPLLGVEEVGGLNLELSLSSLTPELVRSMAEIPMVDAVNVIYVPGFQNLGLAKLRLDLKNVSLVEKIVGLYAARNNMDPEVARTTAAVSAAMAVSFMNNLENGADLGEAISSVILEPDSLVVDVSPAKPLSVDAVNQSESHTDLLNSMGASVTVNGGTPLVLRFAPPPPPAAPEELDELDGLEDFNPEEFEDLEDLDTNDGLDDLG